MIDLTPFNALREQTIQERLDVEGIDLTIAVAVGGVDRVGVVHEPRVGVDVAASRRATLYIAESHRRYRWSSTISDVSW